MTAAEFTAIVGELHERAATQLRLDTDKAKRVYLTPPPVWIFGVSWSLGRFHHCTPYDHGTLPAEPVCWITWETRRSDDELRDVLGQALSVLMRELGMEWPR